MDTLTIVRRDNKCQSFVNLMNIDVEYDFITTCYVVDEKTVYVFDRRIGTWLKRNEWFNKIYYDAKKP